MMSRPKLVEERNQKYYAIRTYKEIYNEYVKISNLTLLPICKLAEIALPLLKKKFRIKDEVANGGSKL